MMRANVRGSRTSDHLNLIRGLAAVAVLLYHVRYRFFFDYRDVADPGWFARLFYSLTAFGHDAVMIFFVLSGYFIASSVCRDLVTNRWSWKDYALNRLTRLYVVIIPGLLLTFCWDRLGLGLYPDNPIYTGGTRSWSHDFFNVEQRLTAEVFFSNLFFLQTILTPSFGSNDPLWSLSYEYWYYVLFPLMALAAVGSTHLGKKVMYLVLCAVILFAIGKNIAIYFPIWLL